MIKKPERKIYVNQTIQPNGCVWVKCPAKHPMHPSAEATKWLEENIGPEHSGWYSTGNGWTSITSGWMIHNHADALAFKLRFGL